MKTVATFSFPDYLMKWSEVVKLLTRSLVELECCEGRSDVLFSRLLDEMVGSSVTSDKISRRPETAAVW